MMSQIRKIMMLGGMVLVATTTLYAGTVQTTPPLPSGTVLVGPSDLNPWSLGLTALMLMPVDKFQYVQAVLPNQEGVDYLYHNESVDNQKSLGEALDIAYRFAGTGRDLTLHLMTLDSSDTEAYNTPVGTVMYGINRTQPLVITQGGNASAKSDYDYQAGDLVFGQWLTVAKQVDLHPFAGLRYAHLDSTGKVAYQEANAPVGEFKSDSTFDGVGLRAGLDAKWHLFWDLSLVGTAGTALLVGDLNDPYKMTVSGQTTSYKTQNDTAVVPEWDTSLGLDYQHNFANQQVFNLQFGWEMLDYLDADAHDYVGTTTVNSQLNNSDFGLHGFYLRAAFQFA